MLMFDAVRKLIILSMWMIFPKQPERPRVRARALWEAQAVCLPSLLSELQAWENSCSNTCGWKTRVSVIELSMGLNAGQIAVLTWLNQVCK